jgi:hypothetical protein
MTANTKKIVIASSIIGAIVIVATAITIRNKRKKLEAKIKAGSVDVIEPSVATISSVSFPLKKGSGVTTAERNAVKVVQRYLNTKTAMSFWMQMAKLQEDGVFGPLTEETLSKFAGVKEVSYSLYKDMQSSLSNATDFLSPSSIDPVDQKNNPPDVRVTLFDVIKAALFG